MTYGKYLASKARPFQLGITTLAASKPPLPSRDREGAVPCARNKSDRASTTIGVDTNSGETITNGSALIKRQAADRNLMCLQARAQLPPPGPISPTSKTAQS